MIHMQSNRDKQLRDLPIHQKTEDVPQPTLGVEFTREEVKHIETFVIEAMKALEHLRDARDDSFDADRYIALKYLLLDIKIWLTITVID